jgi:hypothetical protein
LRVDVSLKSNRIDESSPPIRTNCAPAASSRHPHRPQTEGQPEITARLEWLDDLIFAAIGGDPSALQKAAPAWQEMLEELGAAALEESRLQYLRCAQTVWYALRQEPNHPPHKVFAAIEIISLLADKAW